MDEKIGGKCSSLRCLRRWDWSERRRKFCGQGALEKKGRLGYWAVEARKLAVNKSSAHRLSIGLVRRAPRASLRTNV